MAFGAVGIRRYERCLEALRLSNEGSQLSRRSALILVWLALNGGGTFEQLNTGISSMFGIGSGLIREGLFDLRGAGLARLTSQVIPEGERRRIGRARRTSHVEWIVSATLTPRGERTAAVVQSA